MTRFALLAEAPWWEVWRLWTCHVVHYSAAHLALNAIAALPPVVLGFRRAGRWPAVPSSQQGTAGQRPARQITIWLFIAAPLISIAILLIAKPAEYRGASALVMALWFLVPGRIGYVLIGCAAVKLVVETIHPFGDALPLAHWLGAAAGAIGALILRRCSPSSS